MKPGRFVYHRPHGIAEAIDLLGAYGDDARVIAGGQSLVAMMNFRLARPSHLIDIGRISALHGLAPTVRGLRLGALTTHYEVETSREPSFDRDFAVLRDAMQWIGHLPIRTRGTVGGSLAHADATAEWCLLAILLDAEITVTGPAGDRAISASQFFQGYYTTALEPAEVVTAVLFPRAAPNAALHEFAERRGDFAIAAVAVDLSVVDGVVTGGSVAIVGAQPVPTRVSAAERLLIERPRGPHDSFADIADAVRCSLEPPGGGPDRERRHLERVVGTLTERACIAAARAGENR